MAFPMRHQLYEGRKAFSISEAFCACRRVSEVALHALRHLNHSAQQGVDNGAPGNARSEAALGLALQDFLYWLSSYRCHTCLHMSQA